nr:reverse transcriptase domain-containing protein [uncultured Carboxylicivirga sp.]
MKKKKDWFLPKGYPHIELPLKQKDRPWVASYIEDDENISKHSFLPFIHKQIVTRKFRKRYDCNGNVLNNGERISDIKIRNIFYASHFDSQIFSYYSSILSKQYEKRLIENDLTNIATAYRRIPILADKKNSRNMCNIDFANEVFEYIRSKTPNDLVAISFDIKSFFDNLNHNTLKRQWIKILDVKNLPDDHYNVFKNITQFSYVYQSELFNTFKKQIWVESKTGIRSQKWIKENRYLKSQGAIAYCKKSDFLNHKYLIKSNKYVDSKRTIKRIKGIPQGSPISAVLANIYMFDFDLKIKNVIGKEGLYRRYSDDMVVVCEKTRRDEIIDIFSKEIRKYQLEIQASKTQVFHFVNIKGEYNCFNESENGSIKQTKLFEYLGFAFDGKNVFLKSSSLATYYRKMKRVVRRHKYYAKYTKDETSKGEIFRKRLFLRYSYKGAQRRRVFRMNPKTHTWHITHKFDWGNYITYAKLAQNNIKNNKIKQQIKNHWKILNDEINKKM